MWKLLAILISLGLGLLLLWLTLTFIVALLRTPQVQQLMVSLGLLLLALWLLWSKLPDWLQDALRRTVTHRRRDDED